MVMICKAHKTALVRQENININHILLLSVLHTCIINYYYINLSKLMILT